MNGSGDLWYVKLTDGQVHRVTLDQLDEAFQGGHINENTLVLPAGGTQWLKLGDAAGLDDAATPAAPSPAPVAAPARVAAPAAVMTAMTGPAAQPRPAVAVAYAPVRSQYVAPAPAPNPNSLRPVSMDLGDAGDIDLDVAFAKKGGSGKRWIIGGLAVALLAAGGVGAARPDLRAQLFGGGGDSAAAAAVVTPPPPAVAPPPPPVTPTPAPVSPPSTTTVATGGGESGLNPRFTDSQRQKLLDADKARDQKTKARAAVRSSGGGSQSSPSSRGKSPVFTTSGNKFDPLNSSI